MHSNVLSRRTIEGLIAKGQHIIIVDGQVLKLDAWMAYHPGGTLVIQHMIGRDASDEVTVLHSAAVKKSMKAYRIGRIEGAWKNFKPPIQGGHFEPLPCEADNSTTIGSERGSSDEEDYSGLSRRHTRSGSSTPQSLLSIPTDSTINDTQYLDTQTKLDLEGDLSKYPSLDVKTQEHIVTRYRAMRDVIEAKGLFECDYKNYGLELTRYACLFGIFAYALTCGWYKTSAVFLGLFWHQLVFSAHDAGHIGITHHYQTDTIIGIVIADFIGGLSMGWWKRSHNVHHIVTNLVEHDPDIQLLPFFAVSHRFFESIFSSYRSSTIPFDAFSKFLIPYQHYLYYPVLALGRFNLYLESWKFLLTVPSPQKGPARWHRTLEIVGQMFFWYWFGYIVLYRCIPTIMDRVIFVLLSHIVTAPLHVQITMSHYGMSTADLGVDESFAQRMLRTTMDVDCPHWLDFIHGGLQFQAIHHLYPRIPRHNLRSAQKLVQEFCLEVGIPYALMGFVDGNKQVISHLAEVGRHATILAQCHQAVSHLGDFGMH